MAVLRIDKGTTKYSGKRKWWHEYGAMIAVTFAAVAVTVAFIYWLGTLTFWQR